MLGVSKSLGWGLFLAGSVAAFAQNPLVPQGGEFTILGNIPGDQVLPSISLLPNIGVVAWQDNVVDKNGSGIGGSLLSEGFGAGPIFGVNKTATGNQINPKVQLLANDYILYVWQSSVSGTPCIYARIAKPTVTTTKTTVTNGTRKTVESTSDSAYGTNFGTIDLRVNAYIKDQQINPAVAALPGGDAIIAWQSYGQDGSMWGVYARKISPKGAFAPAMEFKVNQYTQYNQRNPAVATLANGNYVIAWVSEQERFYQSVDIYARVFTANGAPVTEEIPINSTSSICDSPDVAALNDGGFTVVWTQKGRSSPTNTWDIWGRAFNATGSPEVTDFQISTFVGVDKYRAKIAAGPSGSMVVWTALAEDGSREGVFGRFLQGGTAPAGNEMQVNTTWISQQLHPAVSWNGVNNFLVVWTSFAGATGFDLYGQAYSLNTSP
jgi:hypothetical protein